MSSNEAKDQPADISNLQQSFSQQQEKISALKELVRKSGVEHGKSTSTAQEKVRNIEQRLKQLKSKARSRQSLDAPSQYAVQASTSNAPVTLTTEQPSEPHSVSLTFTHIATPTSSNLSTPNPTPLKPQQRSESNTSLSSSTGVGTPSSEKILLLRQQMEQNRALMAQRASSKLHLEQLVTQLKEKFDTTQQCLENTSELGKSMTDLSALVYTPTTRERYKSATDLTGQPFSLEKERIKFLENRCRLLEKQLDKERQNNVSRDTSLNESVASDASAKRIKELENKVLELEQVQQENQSTIESKAQEESLASDVDLVAENARLSNEIAEQASELQKLREQKEERSNESYDSSVLESENERLRNEIDEKSKRITELAEINDVLETTRCDLTMKNNAHEERIQQLQTDIENANAALQRTKDELEQLKAKSVAVVEDAVDDSVVVETAKDTDAQVKAELAKQIQELQDQLQQLQQENQTLQETVSQREKLEVSDASIAEKIAALEATIESQRDDLKQRTEALAKQEEELMEKTIELNVLSANFKVLEEKLQASSKNKSLFSSSSTKDTDNTELQAEVQQVKQKLDESNKAMIKLKLKYKQSEKQVEKLKKSSDLHAEVVRLQHANEELQQKITELEDEKGQWQLTHVDDVKAADSGGGDGDGDQMPLAELAAKCKTQTETICLLEQQNYEQSQKLEVAQQQLHTLQTQLQDQSSEETARVKSEMSEIQLEEQLEEQTHALKALQTRLDDKNAELIALQQKFEDLQTQKQEVDKKLEHYINENMELLDKIEKLSKSSSSAESIEIVERLTQQERAELDEFNQGIEQKRTHASNNAEIMAQSVSENTQTEMGHELSDSLQKLREESSELMNKIELFTNERREVLDKMENLTAENHELQRKIDDLTQEKDEMETNALLAENAKSKLESELQELTKEKQLLAAQVAESATQKTKLSSELTSLQQTSEVMAALEGKDSQTLFNKCEKSLSKLNAELEVYRKANDKNAKFNASKKLAKEAKNAHTQLSELLQKVREASSAVETVTVVETVVAVTASNGQALAEYEQLIAQNRTLRVKVDELHREVQELQEIEDAAQSTATVTEITDEAAAIANESAEKLHEAVQNIEKYETQCIELQTTVEDLRLQLQEARTADEEKTVEITRLRDKLNTLNKLSDDFDRLLNDKEISFEQQVEKLTRLRHELEGKCDTYEAEMEILQTLITEQKHQLIEAYKENENEMTLKLLELQQRDEEIAQLRTEMKELKETSVNVGRELSDDLQKECAQLRESLKINKALVAEQINELSNKQETIDTLNQQIIDLYKSMEENANNVIAKDDEIAYLQELIENNTKELETLRKDKEQQKTVVDKLLNELHAHKSSLQRLPQLEEDCRRLEHANKRFEQQNKELEQRNKEQLEKLKKYAANLKKRTTQCQELDTKVKELEKGTLEALQTKKDADHDDAKLKEAETLSNELQEALQAKTVELLEVMERAAKLEGQLQQTQDSLTQKTQEIVQLQNALAASQEHISPWGSTETLVHQNAELTEELNQKSALIDKLQADLQLSQTQINAQNQETLQLRQDLTNSQSLSNELAHKTASLHRAESDLSIVQSEVLQVQEQERIRLQAEAELQVILRQKEEFIEELQKQLASKAQDTTDLQSLQEHVRAQDKRLKEVTDELKAKSLKFEKSKAVIKERNNQIQRLQAQLKDLQDNLSKQPEEECIESPVKHAQLAASPHVPVALPAPQVSKAEHDALQQAYDKLHEKYTTEKTNFQQTIARLETLHDGIQAKLQEDMAYIETLEQENAKIKDKLCKLEECVAIFEERRASMEQRAHLLDAQMQTRTNEYEQTEDALIYRLNMLSEHDDVIGQRLLASQEEKEELQDRLQRAKSELKELNTKYVKLEEDYETYRATTSTKLETENASLLAQLKAKETEIERLRFVYDAKLAAKTTEIDEMECELSDQLDRINAEKRALMENLEKSCDEFTLQKDEIVRLKETLNTLEQSKHELEREATWLRMQNDSSQQDQYDLQELRMQTMQDKTEIDNLRHQIETLAANHEGELQALRTQISELDTLRMQVGQNQTDDQVFIETENKRLTDLLAEKETIIENYQRHNLQLQMAATAAQNTQPDPFALAFGMPPTPAVQATTAHTPQNNDERERLERELNEKSELATRLQRDLNALQAEFHSLLEGNAEMQRQLLDKNREIDNLRATQLRTGAMPNDVIPAPPMFFASEQATPSPFDEIVQMRTIDNALEGAAQSRLRHDQAALDTAEQPTIEDLQRNVSDLEKHAHELENKLAARNQREGEYEERLQELQTRLHETENRAREREQQLQQAQQESQRLEQERATQAQQNAATQRDFEELKRRLLTAEEELNARDEQLKALQKKQQQAEAATAGNTQADALKRLECLQDTLQHLQRLLQERDSELNRLKRALDSERQLRNRVEPWEAQIITDGNHSPGSASSEIEQRMAMREFLDAGFRPSVFDDFVAPPADRGPREPVLENIIEPERAYLCHPAQLWNAAHGDLSSGEEVLDEPEISSHRAAALRARREERAERRAAITREEHLERELQGERERIQELQLALERCEQQKQELQVKSGKIMKKLKEYKTKIDEFQNTSAFRKSSSAESNSNSMFGDLDAAIQDELRVQLTKLEIRLEEQRKLQESSAAEKEKLLKRIDVLTAGNERMSEMKERQDMEVRMYQARIQELQTQLERLNDWGEEENVVPEPVAVQETTVEQMDATSTVAKATESTVAHLEQKIAELTAELHDTNNDRQELKALLEDERANVKRAEQAADALKQKMNALDNAAAVSDNAEKAWCNELKLECQNVKESYNNLQDAHNKLKQELNASKAAQQEKLQEFAQRESQLKTEKTEVETKLKDCQLEITKLQKALQTSVEQWNELQLELLALRTRNEELTQANAELQTAAGSNGDIEAQLKQHNAENEELLAQKSKLEEQLTQLQAENVRLQSADTLNKPTSDSDELSAQLQEKESEIVHLKQRIEDLMREDQTEKLVLEILTKNQEIHLLKIQVKDLEEDKQELEHNLSLQITKEMQSVKEDTPAQAASSTQFDALQQQVNQLQAEKTHMEEELKVLNNHVLNSLEQEDKMKAIVLELDAKNIEIAALRQTLAAAKVSSSNEPTAAAANTPQVDFIALNAQWEAIVEQKCGEIAQMWREHLEQREREFKNTETRLLDEIETLRAAVNSAPAAAQQPGASAETTATTTSASESTTASGTSSAAPSKDGTPLRQRIIHEENEAAADAIIEKMQAALESQEMEIVTLKEQLAIRSAEYARLAAQYDPFKLQTTLSHSGITGGPASLDSASAARRNTGDNALVPKSELDLALYMLHQRDMRCEEMTVELVSLLEERDTLQLKLSNTLRQVEAIKAQTNYSEPPTTDNVAASATTNADSPNSKTTGAGTNADNSATAELNQKLSQLHTVNHSKDKVFKEEREQRIRQMEKIQQDVANIPSAAVSELIGTDLSQTGQSPSSVLLNWLWGNTSNASASGSGGGGATSN